MNDCISFRDRYFAGKTGVPLAPEGRRHLHLCAACREAFVGLPDVDRGLVAVAGSTMAAPPFDTIALAAKGAARLQRQSQAVRRSLPFFYTGLTTAAVAAAIVVAVLASHGAPSCLLPGAELKTTAEAKTAVLRSGARVRLEAGAIRLAAADQSTETLYLSAGRVFLEVPRLAQGATLAVRTADAEVRVHGTRFEVVRTAQSTRVQVLEGLVEVRPEGIGRPCQFLRAGESTTVTSGKPYREGLQRSALEALDQGRFTAAEQQLETLLGAGGNDAQRAETQALLAWSLAARGERAQAVERYREALAFLPPGSTPLWAENACAELAFLVEQTAPKSAAATWKECLHRFPGGIHADRARSRARWSGGR
jgi:hypothetical protein